MPSTGNRAQRREEIRDQLLLLIEGLLDAGVAFADISVEQLATAAGMSRTRFYHYFEDRNDLLHAWFARISSELGATADRWWDATGRITRPGLAALLADLHHVFRAHATLMAAVEAAATTDVRLRTAVEDAMASDARALRGHIRRGQDNGRIDPTLDADVTAEWLTVLCWRGRAHLMRAADAAELEELTRAQAALLWNVLYAFSPPPRVPVRT